MTSTLILSIIIGYFLLLIAVSKLTSSEGSNATFFTGNRSSKWYLVAFGMIGASLSGVTFVSVTGQVDGGSFGYMQMVFGYLIGYAVIAFVLLPVYYKLNVTSIYEYLDQRYGKVTYKTGSAFFLVSRLFGSSVRLLIVARILQDYVMINLSHQIGFDVQFWHTVVISVLLIWVYTQKGGIKTIVYTDALQTLFMLIAAVVAYFAVANAMDFSFSELTSEIFKNEKSQIWFNDVKPGNHWLKFVLGGALIAICMTGLDQDMMQKNLTCKNLKEAQKNMISFSIVLVFVNLFFLMLGAGLMMYAKKMGLEIPMNNGVLIADDVFPFIALNSEIGVVVGVFFLLGLIAAAYSSADSALASLTTAVCVDFLAVKNKTESTGKKTRQRVHIVVSILMILTALVLNAELDKNGLMNVFFLGGLTYGPLLGLFSFGLLTKRVLRADWMSILICVVAAIASYLLKTNSSDWFDGYLIGPELFGINGLVTFIGLYVISKNPKEELQEQALQVP